MILWRISNHATIDGAGGLYASARWHSRGKRIVYFAETPAGALIEVLVHFELPVESLPRVYRVIRVESAPMVSHERVEPAQLAEQWRDRASVTRAVGDAWLKRGSSALLAVPSAIVPETSNWLFNPEHRDAAKFSLASYYEFALDARLLRVG